MELRFLADMGVSQSVVEWLRSEGYDAIHLSEERLQRLPDPEIFDKGLREKRIVITFDLGFGEIVASSCYLTSVIIYRLRDARASHQVDRLRAVLSIVTEELKCGAVLVIEETRHRLRSLPIGE